MAKHANECGLMNVVVKYNVLVSETALPGLVNQWKTTY